MTTSVLLSLPDDSNSRPNRTKCNQSLDRQRLILLMQKLCFGTIHDVPIRNGQPVMDPLPRIVYRKKHGGINQARPQSESADFVLKREVVNFLRDLDAIGNGTIHVIQVAHGLPILYEFEDVIRV